MNDLVLLCRDYGLESLVAHLPALARPSIRLVETEQVAPAGASRLGGLPDVPTDFAWPRLRDCPLSPEQIEGADLDAPLVFLGQLNWAQLKRYDFDNVLPSSGGALFFVGSSEWTYFGVGIESFAPHPIEPPAELKHVVPPHFVVPQFEWTLPYYGSHGSIGGGDSQNCFFDVLSPEIEFLPLSDSECKSYDHLRAHVQGPNRRRHRVLGHPDYVQNPMRLDLERQSRGLGMDYETYLTLCDPEASLTLQLKQQALESKWQLAFQVACLSDAEELWGDGGTYYFWSKQEELLGPTPRFLGDGQCG